MNRLLIQKIVSAACLLIVSAGLSSAVWAQKNSTSDAEAYRQLLLEIVAMADKTTTQLQVTGFEGALSMAANRIQRMDIEQLEVLSQHAPPIQSLRGHIDSNVALIADLKESSADKKPDLIKQIDFPDPQTSIAACSEVSAELGQAALFEAYTAREILVAAAYPCLETVAGENDAALCIPVAIADAALEAAFLAVEACLKEQRDAVLDAVLETEENIADHLESFVDATTSSRATQDSVDDVQTDITASLDLLDTLQANLDNDLFSLESDVDTVLSDLDALIADAVSLAAAADDIQFRVQENQVDIEDAQTRAAEAEATAQEIRTDTQSIISAIETLQNDLDSYGQLLTSGLATTERDALIAALADEDTRVVRFLLPSSSGGELEQIRELVIQAIMAFNSLGNDTTASIQLLLQGDSAYNQGQYINAYDLFARAYRALTEIDDMSKPGIKR